jgi:capsular exopolysaccharide synthesis family protein
MEKLEKALEKARQQRKTHTPAYAGTMESTVGMEGLGGTPSTTPHATHGGVVVSEEQLERNRIIAHRTRNASADVFRILRTQVLQIMNKSDYKTLAITSPNYGDGKTTIALNLAVSIAQDLKQTVLLVDLDLRKPSIGGYLDIHPPHGLTDHLLDNIPISQCLVRLPFERLAILPAGKHLEKSSEILGSPKMAALAHELRSRYPDRFIIYDMPPLLAQDDPITFLPHVDAVLLVVQDGVNSTQEVKSCLNALEYANVIGTVLNNRI